MRYLLFFSGCMGHVVINDKVVDFLQAATVRNKVSPGCSSYQVSAAVVDTFIRTQESMHAIM